MSPIKWFDGIGEYRIDSGPGYRIYLAQDGKDLIILFGGGTKQRQNADIEKAKLLHAEYKTRKAASLKVEAEKAKAHLESENKKRKKKNR